MAEHVLVQRLVGGLKVLRQRKQLVPQRLRVDLKPLATHLDHLTLKRQSSGLGGSHPRPITEPYVNLSAHTALIIQPLRAGRARTSAQIASAVLQRLAQATWLPGFDAL